jgi:hypothetical protein
MSVMTKHDSPRQTAGVAVLWDRAWEWLARPVHYTAVRNLSVAAQDGDGARLASMLHPDVAVVVVDGDGDKADSMVVRGPHDATEVLLHGMASRPGTSIMSRSVNGQAGLLVTTGDQASAMLTIDFTGRLVSMVWVALRPEVLRRWNAV